MRSLVEDVKTCFREHNEMRSEIERLRAQVAVAKQIVTAGVELMTPSQLGQWAGVRAFLEQETDDYEP